MISHIILTCLITVLLLLVEHWFPWSLLLEGGLPRLASYIIGVLALALPLSGLYGLWLNNPPELAWFYLLSLWAVILAGGIAVILAYALDKIMARVRLSYELQELFKLAKEARDGQRADLQ